MPLSRRRVEVAVGAMVLFGMTALLISVIFIGQQRRLFERRVRVQTQFANVGGLQPGAPVHLAGIPVGTVEAIFFSPEGEVEVRLQVRASVFHRIHEDSRARIKSAGLVGDRYIDVTVGSNDAPQVEENGTILGIDPLDVNQVLAEAGPVFRDMATTIENIRRVTVRLLDDESSINQTMENVRVISGNLREGRGTIGRLLTEDDVYEDLRASMASARSAIANAEAITETARGEGPELLAEARAAVGNVSTASARIREVIDIAFDDVPGLMAGLQRSVADLELLLGNLREASEDVKAATPQLPEIMASGQTAVDEARAVLRAARAHPLLRRYFHEDALDAPILVQDRALVADAP